MPPVRVVAFSPPKIFEDWPEPTKPASRAVLVGAVVAGLVAALAVPWTSPGIGWLVTGVVVATVTVLGARSLRGPASGRATWSRIAWAGAALLLLAAVGVLAAPWLGVLCVVTAFGCGAVAVAGGRSLRSMVVGVCMLPIASVWALFWAGRAAPDRDPEAVRRGGLGRLVAAILVSITLLIVFVALFAGADPVFARVVSTVTPTVDGGTVFRWVFSVLIFLPGTLGACFLIASPRPVAVEGEPDRSWRRLEWALPAGTLVVVFAAFVAVQFTVLFGGADHVLTTENLTFAQYARTGFWQLLAVTVLTLLIMAVVARKAVRATSTDRAWLRGLLGALAVLSLVVVASALGRMWTYEQAYGFSRLRVLVSVCELWLGVVFLLVLAAGIRLSAPARWLPQAVVGTGVAALLALAALNPDQFIADRNVDRYLRIGTAGPGLPGDAVAWTRCRRWTSCRSRNGRACSPGSWPTRHRSPPMACAGGPWTATWPTGSSPGARSRWCPARRRCGEARSGEVGRVEGERERVVGLPRRSGLHDGHLLVPDPAVVPQCAVLPVHCGQLKDGEIRHEQRGPSFVTVDRRADVLTDDEVVRGLRVQQTAQKGRGPEMGQRRWRGHREAPVDDLVPVLVIGEPVQVGEGPRVSGRRPDEGFGHGHALILPYGIGVAGVIHIGIVGIRGP